MPPSKKAAVKPDTSGSWVETVKTLVYALLIALAVRTVAFEPFNIPSGSMIPTLLVGDFLFVSKYTYGYSRYSIPFSPPLFGWSKNGRIMGSFPTRGDVVVFRNTRDTSQDWVKRVIGLPGDHIQVKQGLLYINGTQFAARPGGRLRGAGWQRHAGAGQGIYRNATEWREAPDPEI